MSPKCLYTVVQQRTRWPNIVQSLVDSVERRRCSNEAKTRNPLKFARVPQTPELISAASGPKFAVLWEHLEEILLFNNFFPIVNTCLRCEDIARQICAMVPRWRFFDDFLRPVFAACRVQQVSDLHPKFALRPRHAWKLSLIHI